MLKKKALIRRFKFTGIYSIPPLIASILFIVSLIVGIFSE